MPRHRTGSVFQLKDGTWWARVTFVDEQGRQKERRKRARNVTDAKEKRDELLAELKDRGPLAFGNDRLTFEDLATYYENSYLTQAEYRDDRKIAGVRDPAKRKSALKPLKEFFKRKKLRLISYGDLRNYRLARLRAKNQRNEEQRLSVATVNRELSVLRRMLGIARQQRWIRENPFQFGESLITPADEQERGRILTQDEETRLLAECVEPREHLRGIILCALDTGMRRGEILKLRWQDVDTKTGLLNVVAMHTKTLRHRQLALSERLIVELERLHELAKPKPTARVFGLENNFKRSFATACKNAKITDLRFHDLRHTFATRLTQGGMSLAEVQRLLGHSELKTTFRYVNATPETLAQAVRILERLERKTIDAESNDEARWQNRRG